ncbi:MAG: pyridoxine 5'-phosphate synthase [Rhodospirillales bacterium]|nr:pyridoxine 5'-phosphate synthase [Rhodospirillales bacterium]
MAEHLRLGVNIDHVATIRNARGGYHPDPVRAARMAVAAGADGITAHLREDRRHISDDDMAALVTDIPVPFNMEMAACDDMLAVALRLRPHAVCLVPERREERTTEGGLDAVSNRSLLAPIIGALGEAGIRVSLFVEPSLAQLDAARDLGAPVVEIHTGAYCDAAGAARQEELTRIQAAARHCQDIGLECHAGHGLTYETVGAVAAIPNIMELNIGHFLVGEAIFIGFEASIRRMRHCMDEARSAGIGG